MDQGPFLKNRSRRQSLWPAILADESVWGHHTRGQHNEEGTGDGGGAQFASPFFRED